jgi:hypothetical protein
MNGLHLSTGKPFIVLYEVGMRRDVKNTPFLTANAAPSLTRARRASAFFSRIVELLRARTPAPIRIAATSDSVARKKRQLSLCRVVRDRDVT